MKTENDDRPEQSPPPDVSPEGVEEAPPSPPPAPEPALRSLDEPADAGMSLMQVLEMLEPPEDPVCIVDEWGREYPVRTRIGARKQIQVMRALRRMLEQAIQSGSVDEAEQQVRGLLQAGPEALIAAVVPLLTEEEVLEEFEGAFKKAQPRLFKAALKALTEEDRDDLDLADDARPSPADLFPAEEMVKALYPSLLRLLHTVGSIAVRALGRAE